MEIVKNTSRVSLLATGSTLLHGQGLHQNSLTLLVKGHPFSTNPADLFPVSPVLVSDSLYSIKLKTEFYFLFFKIHGLTTF